MQPNHPAGDPRPWTIVESHPDYVLATWQQIFAVFWRRETTLDGTVRMREASSGFASRHPRGIGLLTIVGADAPLPTSEARKALTELLAAGSSFIRCSAILFEGTGFRASAVRSVVTGLVLLARQPYPHRVCDTDQAADMFARILPESTGGVVNASAVKQAIERLRTTLAL